MKEFFLAVTSKRKEKRQFYQKKPTLKQACRSLFVFLALMSTTSLSALDAAWNVDADGNWNNNANWTAAFPNLATETATFGNVITAPRNVTVNVGIALGTATFDNANAYTLDGGGPLSMSGTITITNANGNGAHVISCPVVLVEHTNLTQGSTGTFTISGVISSTVPKALTKLGTETLALTGINTYTGGTIFSGGTIQADKAESFGTGAITLTSGTMDITAAVDIANNITLGGGSVNVGGALTPTLSGIISGGSALTKTGTGTLILSGNNTYTAGTSLNAGTISVSAANNLGTGTLTFGGGTLNATGSYTLANNMALGANGPLEVDDAQTLTASGALSGANTLEKTGVGVLVLTGASGAFAGGITLTDGELECATAPPLGTGTITIGVGDLNITGTYTLTNPFTLNGTGDINVGATQVLTLSGKISGSNTLNKSGTGQLTLTNAANDYNAGIVLQTGTLQGTTSSILGNINNTAALIFSQTTDGTYSGGISGTGTVTKEGTGSVTFSGGNSYSGGTSINAGTLIVSAENNLGTSGLTFNGATLNTTASFDFTKGVTLTGTGTFKVDANTTLNIQGDIGGASTLIKTGDGTLVISGANNTYSGGTTISAGTLEGTTTSIQGNVTDNSILTFDQGADGTYTGVISGTGSVLKKGGGIVTFGGVNTYSGGTTIEAGTLSVAADNNLGTGALTFTGGTLNTSQTFNSAKNVIMTGAGTIDTDNATTLTLTGVVSGAGAFTKAGAGRLVFDTTNTYSGGTTISAGILQVKADGNMGTAGLTFNGGTLNTTATFSSSKTMLFAGAGTIDTDASTTLTLSGVLSGGGAFTKAGAGRLVLSAINSYSGGTTMTAGTLQVSADSNLGTGSLTFNGGTLNTTGTFASAKAVSLAGAGTINTNPGRELTLSGVISGGGTLTKSGEGTLSLTGTNTYTGQTTVTAGTLKVDGSIATSTLTTINPGTTLRGTGTVGSLTNNGTTAPGNSIGTLTVAGNFIQGPNGTLEIELNAAGQNDLINATGSANVDGTVSIIADNGMYAKDTTYTIVIAPGGVTGNFATVANPSGISFQPVYNATNIQLNVTSDSIFPPVATTSLVGNSRHVAAYMYDNPSFPFANTDLTKVSELMLSLSSQNYEKALVKVSPLATAGINMANFQNSIQMAEVLDKQYRKKIGPSKSTEECPDLIPCYAVPQNGIFIEPIGVFYNQHANGEIANLGQIPFISYTYGAGLGWELLIGRHLIFEAGVGYTHTNLDWKDSFGSANWDSIYVAPFFGWYNARAFGNVMVMGGFNYNDVKRRIVFGGMERKAESKYHSYDLLLRANGGARFFLGYDLEGDVWFQPEATVNYLYTYTKSYKESGAGSISLDVKGRTTQIIQPSFRARIVLDYLVNNVCLAPSIYLGWLANIPIDKTPISARFREAPNLLYFNIQGYNEVTNQMIVGFEFIAQNIGVFQTKAEFEADLLSRFEVYIAKLKFELAF